MNDLCEFKHPKPCQHTDWTREDVERLLKKNEYPNWYRIGAKSKYAAMGIVK